MKKLINILNLVLVSIFNYSLYCLSFLVPRNRKKWVFGTYIPTSFNDNPKYLFLYVHEYCPGIRAVWITANRNIYRNLKQLGFSVYMKSSIRGIWHCLTAKVYFYNAYAEDVNFFTSGGAVLVNLWHGVGLKKIEFNIERGILAGRYKEKKLVYRIFKPWLYKRPSWLISSTEFQSVPFSTAFRIPLYRCLNTGYPRNDFLLKPEAERRRLMQTYEPTETLKLLDFLRSFVKVYIYMPTWRDEADFLRNTGIDFRALNDILRRTGSILILKLHINTREIKEIGSLSNIILLPGNMDVYTLLPYTDTLITDYSSVLYDYILMPDKQVVLYLFDYDKYVNDRDFNYPFLPNVAGKIIKEVSEFYGIFDRDQKPESVHNIPEIREKFWGSYRGNAAEKITGFIRDQILIRP